MKKILLLVIITSFILVVSGCCSCNIPFSANLGASPTPAGQPTTIPTSAPAVSTAPVTGTSFAGTWDTDYGNMVLTATGNKVTGTYESDDGAINGTATGNTLTGTWTETPTRTPPDDAGDFAFTLAADGSTFDGNWRYGHSDDPNAEWSGTWHGTRIT